MSSQSDSTTDDQRELSEATSEQDRPCEPPDLSQIDSTADRSQDHPSAPRAQIDAPDPAPSEQLSQSQEDPHPPQSEVDVSTSASSERLSQSQVDPVPPQSEVDVSTSAAEQLSQSQDDPLPPQSEVDASTSASSEQLSQSQEDPLPPQSEVDASTSASSEQLSQSEPSPDPPPPQSKLAASISAAYKRTPEPSPPTPQSKLAASISAASNRSSEPSPAPPQSKLDASSSVSPEPLSPSHKDLLPPAHDDSSSASTEPWSQSQEDTRPPQDQSQLDDSSSPASEPWSQSLVGQIIFDRYKVLDVIGKGSSSIVYSAVSVGTNETVAIKTPSIWKPGASDRFRDAAIQQGRLNHPNIVRTLAYLESSTTDRQPFFIMENVSEMSLLPSLGRLTDESVIASILTQICDALIAAGKSKTVHGKLSPKKILVLPSNDQQIQVKVLDFGTANARTVGKIDLPQFLYQSPEQSKGEKPSEASDVYSIGAIAWTMVTGQNPPDNISSDSIRKYSSEISAVEQLDLLIKEALERNPNFRIESAQEFRNGVNEWIETAEQLRNQAAHLPPSMTSSFGFTTGSHSRLEDIGIQSTSPKAPDLVSPTATTDKTDRSASAPTGFAIDSPSSLEDIGITPSPKAPELVSSSETDKAAPSSSPPMGFTTGSQSRLEDIGIIAPSPTAPDFVSSPPTDKAAQSSSPPPGFTTGSQSRLEDIGIIPPPQKAPALVSPAADRSTSPSTGNDPTATKRPTANEKVSGFYAAVPKKFSATVNRIAALAKPLLLKDVIPQDFDSESSATQAPLDPSQLAGTMLFGTYRILRVIGEGSTSIVYLAKHMYSGSDRLIAIKTIKSKNPEIIEAFSKDARIQGKLQHPDIVQTMGYLESTDGTPFLLMEYLDGVNMSELLASFSYFKKDYEFASMARQILSALSYAHEAGIIHGNLKPSNIFLHERDGNVVVKILDFGHNKPKAELRAIAQGDEIPNLEFKYFSPEQIIYGECSIHSDIYAVAVLSYQLLSGKLPHAGQTIAEQTNIFTSEELQYPRISELRPDLCCVQELSQLLDESMDRDEDWRCGTIQDLETGIEAWLSAARLERGKTEAEEELASNRARRIQHRAETSEILKAQTENLIALKRKQFHQEQTVLMQFASNMAVKGPRQSPIKTVFKLVFLVVGLVAAITVITFYVQTNFTEIKAGFISASESLSRMCRNKKSDEIEDPLSADTATVPKVPKITGLPKATTQKLTDTASSPQVAKPVRDTRNIFLYENSPQFNKFMVTKHYGKPRRLEP